MINPLNVKSSLGWWVAFERAIDDGPKAVDLQKAIDVCKSTGAEWIAVRGGAGGHDDADLNAESIAAYREAGIEPIVWVFNYQRSQQAELDDFARFAKMGVTKAILNAEFEYIPASEAQARSLVQGVRDLGYEWVAHAPPDYAGGRGEGALAALDEVCDAILPQVYAFEHNDKGHLHHIAAVVELYAARGYGLDKVWPVLGSYRPRTRGYSKNPTTGKTDVPIPTARLTNEAERVSADVVAGLVDCFARGVRFPSIYSIDAMNFANHDRTVGEQTLAAVIKWYDEQHAIVAEPGVNLGDAGHVAIGRVEADHSAAIEDTSPDGIKIT